MILNVGVKSFTTYFFYDRSNDIKVEVAITIAFTRFVIIITFIPIIGFSGIDRIERKITLTIINR